MNIFDMPFWAASFFPTKSVENGRASAEKIGKSYGEEDGLVGEERWRFKARGGRSREEREKGDEEVREKLDEVRRSEPAA